MEEETIKKIRDQHIESYKNAILENIKNNTNVLVDEDIMSLIRKPPLDSMDLIKTKFLDFAKKSKIILDIGELDKILEAYRIDINKCLIQIKDIRLICLSDKVNNTKIENNNDIIKINKKDFANINKQIKSIVKNQLKESFDKSIKNNINNVFVSDTNEEVKEKIIVEITNYINGVYQKQLLDNIDFKILVKDTTLINGTKEQSEHYLFTIKNSRLLNDVLGE